MYKHDDPEDAHSHGYIYNKPKIAFFLKLVLQNNRSTHWKHEFIQQKYCKTQCETHISKIRHGDKMLQGLSKRQKTDLENEQSDQGRCSGRDLVFRLFVRTPKC